MSVDCRNPFIASGNEQFALDKLLDSENYTILASQSDGSSSILDSFRSIFYLPEVNIPSCRLY